MLDLRWFWKYDIQPGDRFHARLRLSTGEVTGVDLLNASEEMIFPISGTSSDFEMFETAVAIGDAFRSFDLSFISGGGITALGSMFIDDISVALRAVATALPGDFNDDGIVDAADYITWRKTDGTTQGYNTWRANFGNSLSGSGSTKADLDDAAVPEPSLLALSLLGIGCLLISQRRHRA
jgi:hypothetical protein